MHLNGVLSILYFPFSAAFFGHIEVQVGESHEWDDNTVCQYIQGGLGPGAWGTYTCAPGTTGSRVGLRRMAQIQGEDNAALTLCEVRVLGTGK